MARTRRTAVDVDRAILAAVLEDLDERGYLGVTFEGVARRAGTSKPVVYRRHNSRASLVLAALTHRLEDVPVVPTVGDLRTDLIALLEGAAARAAAIGEQTYRGLVGELLGVQLPEMGRLVGLVGDRIDAVLEPARDRGELGPAPIPAAVRLLPLVLLRDRALFGSWQAGDVEATVDLILLPLLRATSPPG